MSQRGRKVQSIIPLNLDNYMFSGDWTSGYGAQIRSRMAADFTGWELDSREKFDGEVDKLIRALRADQTAREKPPHSKL